MSTLIGSSDTRIAIYTGDLNYSVCKGIISLLDVGDDREIRIFLGSQKLPMKKKIKLQLLNLKKNRLLRIQEVLSILGNRLISKIFSKRLGKFGCDQVTDYTTLVKQHRKISIEEVSNINSTASIELIKLFNPDLGVSLAAPILKKQVIEIAKLGNLNLHKGKLPNYRGMPPAFWEIYNNEPLVGCSVHIMSEKLDEGDIVLEDVIPIEKWSTARGLQIKLDEMGVKLMRRAIEQVISNTMVLQKQEGKGRTNTKPTLKQSRQLKKKVEEKEKVSLLKKLLKSFVFSVFNVLYAPIRSYIKGLLGKQDIIIILYHRVNDYQRDSLTVGVEQFNEQMEYLNNKFPVASLKSLIKGNVSRFEKKPIIIVSFDDGYLDNYENAFPICIRNNIPCSFFVSTDMIDLGKSFPHDYKLKGALKNMTWNQLKEMKKNGMYIGSHTCSHIDCSVESSLELERQFSESKKLLNNKLGNDMSILAYPFGGIHQFPEHAKKIAIQNGYSAVLSAYGGINEDVDLFDIKRGGVDWKYTHQAFKARLYGWKQ